VSDVAWSGLTRMEADVRQQMQALEESDERLLGLIDLLPLPDGLLELGAQLGETETDLRSRRRETFTLINTPVEGVASKEFTFSPAGFRKLQKITGRQSPPEITLQIIDLKMVADRINKVRSMGRA
jgi:hypothetical protein